MLALRSLYSHGTSVWFAALMGLDRLPTLDYTSNAPAPFV